MNRYLKLLVIWTILAFTVGGIAGWQIGRQGGARSRIRLERIVARQGRG